MSHLARYLRDCLLQQRQASLARKVRGRGLTYLSSRKMRALLRACGAVRRGGVEGVFIEAGCALGGSSAVIANARPETSALWLYDTFEGMPSPTSRDSEDVHRRYRQIVGGRSVGIKGAAYYGYRNDLEEHLRAVLLEYVPEPLRAGIVIHRGLVQDTMRITEPVAFAHVDVDWYDPVLTCAERIYPRLAVGGRMIFDDYFDYGSCRRAVDDFFAQHRDEVAWDVSGGSCCITRIARLDRAARPLP